MATASNAPSTSQNAYLRTKILTASPAELRLLLLDGAVRFAEQGREGLARIDHEAIFNGFTRCQDIVMELINGLKPQHDPELCKRLSSMYTYIYRLLINAVTERSTPAADEAIELLRYERETWMMAMEQMKGVTPEPHELAQAAAGISVSG